jgi:hypothetical protein
MNRKITAIFISTVLPTALMAGQSGLTADILSRASSVNADAVALKGSVSGPQGMLRAIAANETASLANIRAGLVTDTFSSAETQIGNSPSGLNTSLSSASMAGETASLANTRAGLAADTFSGAQAQLTNNPSSLNASLSSGLLASETVSLVAPRAAQTTGNFSNAETQMTNVPASLGLSPSSSSNLLQQELEQQHNSQQPGSLTE